MTSAPFFAHRVRATTLAVLAAAVLIAVPVRGRASIIATDAPLPLLNVVAGVVYALAMPFVALTTLPAEVEFSI